MALKYFEALTDDELDEFFCTSDPCHHMDALKDNYQKLREAYLADRAAFVAELERIKPGSGDAFVKKPS